MNENLGEQQPTFDPIDCATRNLLKLAGVILDPESSNLENQPYNEPLDNSF